MRMYKIDGTDLEISRIAFGCMNIGGSWDDESPIKSDCIRAMNAINAALEQGINFFDHADIYCRGKSEQVFSNLWNNSSSIRQKIILQSKCGIRLRDDPVSGLVGRYDFSYQHILASVEGSLKRLKTDYLDILLLHRPDPLVEPEEVAHAFDDLKKAGKVRHFGVSNHTAAQISLLRKHLTQEIIFNQVEFNLIHLHLLNEGIMFNQNQVHPISNEGTLEYCRLNNILLQAWSPLVMGQLTTSENPKKYSKVKEMVNRMAKDKKVPREAILIAWILRHPMKIQPIIGTTMPERIKRACEGDQVDLTREDWYKLFVAGRGDNLP